MFMNTVGGINKLCINWNWDFCNPQGNEILKWSFNKSSEDETQKFCEKVIIILKYRLLLSVMAKDLYWWPMKSPPVLFFFTEPENINTPVRQVLAWMSRNTCWFSIMDSQSIYYLTKHNAVLERRNLK